MATLKIGWVGDSITAGTNGDPVGSARAKLTAFGNVVASVNRGVSGMGTTDWLPSGGLLAPAKAAFAAAGVTLVHVMLGTNDARDPNNLAAAAHAANMGAIVRDLVGSGYQVVISKPPYSVLNSLSLWHAETAPIYRDYWTANQALMDGASVFPGDSAMFALTFLDNTLLADGVHPTGAGNAQLGGLWAAAILQRAGLRPALRGGFRLLQAGTTAAPAAVASLAVASASPNAISLSWMEPGAAPAARVVRFRLAGSGNYGPVPGGTFGATGGTAAGLAASTAYDFQVVESNASGTGPAATLLNVLTAAPLAPPAAVASLAVASASSSAVTLSWSEPGAAPLSRTVTCRAAGSGSYAPVPGGTFGAAGGTVTGLSASTAYDFRVVESNEAGAGPAATLAGVSTAAPAPGLLDLVSANVAAAVSLRKLRTAYSGPAVTVVRSADGASQAIGFDASGNLDTTALLAFVGSGNGDVSAWADQSTANQGFIQAAGAMRPRLVSGGAVMRLGNAAACPALSFAGGSGQAMTNAAFALGGSAYASVSVISRAAAMAMPYARLLSYAPAGASDTAAPSVIFGIYKFGMFDGYVGGDAAMAALGASPAQVASVFSGSQHTLTIDGAAAPPVSVSNTAPATGIMSIGAGIGSADAAQAWDGMMAEHIIVSGPLSAGDQAAIRGSQQTYYGTP